ncbi:hypothetical protein AMTR_s00116p00087510 [Amborella trichopoda]|uniref:Aspartic peptidase DDI1-type domain-containing protein n=1 Tax=Amborella trichopoda TaxID=13333 RepID=W1NQN1_AMBTC|nr:hypothetical protein AMTR_s00116p00087510 [Amborella trichopoda]
MCSICKGPNRAINCPKKKSLNTVQNMEEDEEEVVRSTPLQHHTIQKIKVTLNGKEMKAMVDTRATLNFVAANETVQLGLKLAVDGNKLKTEHAAPQSFEGAARDVPLKMGAWRGKVTLVAVPYDDFEVIHGLEFPANAKAVVVPHLGVVTICDETCLVWCLLSARARGRNCLPCKSM